MGSNQDAPPEALPSTLDSPYSPAATDKGDTDTMTPSSQKQYSSTAGDPPNEALTKGAMDGSLPDRNPQPNADVGYVVWWDGISPSHLGWLIL